ncbi:EamA family transporter [Larkinella knui]|uniref:EamA family transporter n=1 Tax=Larkinella knui TaxID=2025310 RepID=A0A3P1CWF9_9BACT|nr:EamA family transporter [Larkinella knui]RRB17655.1 EamA family transporter [Larkinella knui]
MNTGNVSRVWLVAAFIAVYFVWGTTYLANLYALKAMPPFIISALRYLAAGFLLATLAYGRKQEFPDWKEIRDLAISGILMLVGGSGLVVVAEQYITSGTTAVIVATEPLWFVLLDYPRWKLYFSDRKVIAGLLLGFVGILLFTRFTPVHTPQVAQSPNLVVGTVIVLAGSILWVIGTLFTSRRIKPGRYTLWHPTIQLLAAGLFSGLVAQVKGEWYAFDPQDVPLAAWGGLGFLILFGSLIAYLAFAWLVTVQPPALVSTHTYVNPLVAVFVGWLAVGEPIAGQQLIALAVVLTGVVLTQLSTMRAGAEG